MSTAASVALELDQGSDFAVQIYWTSGDSVPYQVVGPMRMEVRNEVGNLVATLASDENSEDLSADDQTIGYNTESGLIQLYISEDMSDTMGPGQFSYDLFCSYVDNNVTGKVRRHRLIQGTLTVNGKVTQNV